MTVIRLFHAARGPAVLTIAAVILACSRGSAPNTLSDTSRLAEGKSDSSRIAALAIAAVARAPDTLIEYHVIRFVPDSLGWVVSVVPQVRAPYSDSIAISGGGGLVRVWRGDSVTVLDRYR